MQFRESFQFCAYMDKNELTSAKLHAKVIFARLYFFKIAEEPHDQSSGIPFQSQAAANSAKTDRFRRLNRLNTA